MRKNNLIVVVLLGAIAVMVFWLQSHSAGPAKHDLSGVNISDCNVPGEQLRCWQNFLRQTLDQQGLPAAFDKLADLYATQPAFASECHAFTHQLGEEAYQLFATRQDFELNSKTSYCGYGFYHGFMETLLHSTSDVKQAQAFCDYVGKKLAGQTTDGAGACYHGIGHGAVDGTDIAAWGNPQAMINPSLKLCVFVSGDNQQYLYRCVTGVYNALEILSSDSKYKLTMIQKNPFWLCPSQPANYQEPCYTNMLPALLRLTGEDLAKSEKIVEKIPNNGPGLKTMVASSLFHEFIRLNLNLPDYNIEKGIQLCHSLTDPYRLACIDGLSGGHMKYGEPTQAYVKGLAFCANASLQPDERDKCYNSILSRLLIWYSPAKSREICGGVDPKFQKYCN